MIDQLQAPTGCQRLNRTLLPIGPRVSAALQLHDLGNHRLPNITIVRGLATQVPILVKCYNGTHAFANGLLPETFLVSGTLTIPVLIEETLAGGVLTYLGITPHNYLLRLRWVVLTNSTHKGKYPWGAPQNGKTSTFSGAKYSHHECSPISISSSICSRTFPISF